MGLNMFNQHYRKTWLGNDIRIFRIQRIELFGISVHWTFSKHHQMCGFRMSDFMFFCDVDLLRTCEVFPNLFFGGEKPTQQTDLWKTSFDGFPVLKRTYLRYDTKKVMPLHVFWCWWEVSNVERFTTYWFSWGTHLEWLVYVLVINPIVGVYIPIMRIPCQGGMTMTNERSLDSGT